MVTLMATWALRDAAAANDAEEIQGQLAVVTREIRPGNSGEIRYEAFGRQVNIPALTVSGNQVSAGSEVVIDRIENGVAIVEEWAVVEQRI